MKVKLFIVDQNLVISRNPTFTPRLKSHSQDVFFSQSCFQMIRLDIYTELHAGVVLPRSERVAGSTPNWVLSVWICMFSPCISGFSPGTPASSHCPKICMLGKLVSLNCSLNECGCLSRLSPCDPIMDWRKWMDGFDWIGLLYLFYLEVSFVVIWHCMNKTEIN